MKRWRENCEEEEGEGKEPKRDNYRKKEGREWWGVRGGGGEEKKKREGE